MDGINREPPWLSRPIGHDCAYSDLGKSQNIQDIVVRFDRGDWLRSSVFTSFKAGVVFETRNTVYALIGPGHEQPASLEDVFSFI
ncbi:DUF6957 family protein [Pseudomonas lijiangensis]|uniref:DUF6957 family protein n=1 Tax=Pseudomonas lijiangensis TaxID=2995658 RepID=UPI003CCED56F